MKHCNSDEGLLINTESFLTEIKTKVNKIMHVNKKAKEYCKKTMVNLIMEGKYLSN